MAAADDIRMHGNINAPLGKGRGRNSLGRALAWILFGSTLAAFSAFSCKQAQCSAPEDDHNPCTIDACENGTVTHTYLGDGHPCFFGKLSGVCSGNQCLIPCNTNLNCESGLPCALRACAQGYCAVGSSESNPPSDGNECTVDQCVSGEPTHWPHPDGTPCAGDRSGCLEGVCGSCEVKSDCGVDTECMTWDCEKGVCVPSYKAEGIVLSSLNIQGDCRRWVCDGHGGTELQTDVTDPPQSFDPCFEWFCDGWTPKLVSQLHELCVMDNAEFGYCDEAGACIQCVVENDCSWQERCDQGKCVTCGDFASDGKEICNGSCGTCLGTLCSEPSECASSNCVFTNVGDTKVCCDKPCDGPCQECSALGACENVPAGSLDYETCNSPAEVCNGKGQCKVQTGYTCKSNIDCASKLCDVATGKCKSCLSNADCSIYNTACDLLTKFCK